MKIYQNLVIVKTKGAGEYHELTNILEKELAESGIKNGIMIVTVLHTTAAITMQEPDPAVHSDGRLVLNHVVPLDLEYSHTYEGMINAAAHQKQMLIGNSRIIPIKDGSLILGTWQRPFLIELFKSMQRKIHITIIGE